MVANYKFELDADVLDFLRDKIKTAPKRINAYLSRSLVQNSRKRVVRALRAEPAPNTSADYPLRWKSERQRKFVMAKLRRDGNLPYQRTGQMSAAWEVKGSISGGNPTLEITNDSPHIDYVRGNDDVKQPMFPRWEPYADILLAEEIKLTDIAIDYLLTVLD